MGKGNDPFEKQLNRSGTFKSHVLKNRDEAVWPDRIDYVAGRIAEGDYVLAPMAKNPLVLSDGRDLEKASREFYLRGIGALTGDVSRESALPKKFRLGDLLVEFARLQRGLETVDRRDVPTGEILSRLIMRTVQRDADAAAADLARQLRADAETPRELIAELTTAPELAPLVEAALPRTDDPTTLTTDLASLDLTTQLWDHQFESLALWLYHGANGYVDMATATGKTVLGLAAVAHMVDSGSLHPADQQRLDELFDGSLPDVPRNRPNDVLIVTTDDLLGVQWARLFHDHCQTPPEFTTVTDGDIQLPWGRIDIRSARGLDDVDPNDYRLAIFDEVHNYSGGAGWGSNLVGFVESSCPVLALTGSVTDQLESLVQRADRPFPLVYRYTHRLALADGVIPDFEWTLSFTDVAETNALRQFRRTAEQFEGLVTYDAGTYRLDADALASAVPALSRSDATTMAGEYVSGSALADGLRSASEDGTAPTEELESLASGISNRTIHRLNLRATLDSIVETVEQAFSAGRPALVLTRSYSEAKELWQRLYDRTDDRVVKRLDSDQSADEHDSIIQSFDDAETDRKVLIGPGKRIGQGNDIQSVEVGINIARPGSGVNATLVQRLGRLLRDAGGKDTVEFYHVVGVPPAEASIDPDGEAFVRTVAEFFGQVLEPDTDGILKPPSVGATGGVDSDIVSLEQRGWPHVRGDDQATAIESAYATAIENHQGNDGPTVATDWFTASFGETVQSSGDTEPAGGGESPTPEGGSDSDDDLNSNDDSGSKPADTTGDGAVETGDGAGTDEPDPDDTGDATGEDDSESGGRNDRAGESEDDESDETEGDDTSEKRVKSDPEEGEETTVDQADEDGEETTAEPTEDADEPVDVANHVSPLAEHYDAFRSLGIIHKALRESASSEIPESDPSRRWMTDIQSILSESGYGDQETGYGKQQAARSPFSVSEYRDAHGDGDRVTAFEVLEVEQPSPAVVALLADSLSELGTWVVPVAPESGIALPVVVETEDELDRARDLLSEFTPEPPVFARRDGKPEDGTDDSRDVLPNEEDETISDEKRKSSPENRGPATDGETESSLGSDTPVEDVPGVPEAAAGKLRDAGHDRLGDLRRMSDEELQRVAGVSESRVQIIRATVGSQ